MTMQRCHICGEEKANGEEVTFRNGQRVWQCRDCTIDAIHSAIWFIPSDNRDVWIRVGMAIKRDLGESGFALWDQWSQQAGSYRQKDARTAWKSFSPTGQVSISYLFAQAIANGWTTQAAPPPPKAAPARSENDDAQKQLAARVRAEKIWNGASPAPADHPYLAIKNVEPYGLRISHGCLVVPVRVGAKLHSLQFIPGTGNKKPFLTGSRVRGCYCAIGKPGNTILCIAEGYATAASVHRATQYPVIAALSAWNLLPVATVIRAEYPSAKIIMCADDDFKTKNNPGVTTARAAAKAVGGVVAVPRFPERRGNEDKDFNDLQRVMGLASVKEAVEAASSKESVLVSNLGTFERTLQKIGRYRLANTFGSRLAIADCPICTEDEPEEIGSLTVAEHKNTVTVTCSNGCTPDEILHRLRSCTHG